MDWIDTVIAQFGQQVGIPNLAINSNQRLKLNSDNSSALGIINIHSLSLPELVVYMARPVSHFRDSQIITALKIQDFRKACPWQLQAAFNEKTFFLAFRIPQRSVSIQTINEAVKLLQNTISDKFL